MRLMFYGAWMFKIKIILYWFNPCLPPMKGFHIQTYAWVVSFGKFNGTILSKNNLQEMMEKKSTLKPSNSTKMQFGQECQRSTSMNPSLELYLQESHKIFTWTSSDQMKKSKVSIFKLVHVWGELGRLMVHGCQRKIPKKWWKKDHVETRDSSKDAFWAIMHRLSRALQASKPWDLTKCFLCKGVKGTRSAWYITCDEMVSPS